ncbi:hypothetical protein P9066_11390, partial [Gallibacterium anatis]
QIMWRNVLGGCLTSCVLIWFHKFKQIAFGNEYRTTKFIGFEFAGFDKTLDGGFRANAFFD